jgi:hypothetical protein
MEQNNTFRCGHPPLRVQKLRVAQDGYGSQADLASLLNLGQPISRKQKLERAEPRSAAGPLGDIRMGISSKPVGPVV